MLRSADSGGPGIRKQPLNGDAEFIVLINRRLPAKDVQMNDLSARTEFEELSTIAQVIDSGHASVGRNRKVKAALRGNADGPSSGHIFSY